MGLVLTLAPSGEPLTLAEAKTHCRVDGSDDDALLTALIVTARRMAEHLTGRALMTQSWRYTLDEFHAADIELPHPPLVSVESIKYIAGDGTLTTISSAAYNVYTSALRGRVAPVYGTNWPCPRTELDAVRIELTAGYGNAAAVPQEIKQWMLLCIGGWYANRESIVTSQATPEQLARGMWDALLDAYRVTRL